MRGSERGGLGTRSGTLLASPPPHSSPVAGAENKPASGGAPGGGHTDLGATAGVDGGPCEREPPAWGQGQRPRPRPSHLILICELRTVRSLTGPRPQDH